VSCTWWRLPEGCGVRGSRAPPLCVGFTCAPPPLCWVCLHPRRVLGCVRPHVRVLLALPWCSAWTIPARCFLPNCFRSCRRKLCPTLAMCATAAAACQWQLPPARPIFYCLLMHKRPTLRDQQATPHTPHTSQEQLARGCLHMHKRPTLCCQRSNPNPPHLPGAAHARLPRARSVHL